jgi:hypothetical protein
MKKIVFSLLVLSLFFLLGSCVSTQSGTDASILEPVTDFTFEPDTAINAWLSKGLVYAAPENKASAETISLDTATVKSGTGSLKITGKLPAGTNLYTSCIAFFKVKELLGKGKEADFSAKSITFSVFVPAAPVGGGDYIQVVLKNAKGSSLARSYSTFNYDDWNTVTINIAEYADGSQNWTYAGLKTGDDTEDDVYTKVTLVGIKVGFKNGPAKSYIYYVDDVHIGPAE